MQSNGNMALNSTSTFNNTSGTIAANNISISDVTNLDNTDGLIDANIQVVAECAQTNASLHALRARPRKAIQLTPVAIGANWPLNL